MSYQQEDVPANHPSQQKTKKFFGWKFGTNLTEPQAALLEPMVDVMTEMLQDALFMPAEFDRVKSQHEMALHIIEHAGAAAGLINQISMTLITEKNEEEKLRLMNSMASTLRVMWVHVATLAAKAVVNLDNTLKDSEPNDTDTNVPD